MVKTDTGKPIGVVISAAAADATLGGSGPQIEDLVSSLTTTEPSA